MAEGYLPALHIEWKYLEDPTDPAGVKFTLDVDLRPAFSDVDGNTYYKKTIITSTIPAQ